MKVLLVGGGAREHALAARMAASPHVDALLAAPGNPGIAEHARCHAVDAGQLDALVALVEAEDVDFTVIGPEAPLCAGLADRLAERGRLALGPSAPAARLEGSKVFAKRVMAERGIPTARFRVFDDPAEARAYCRALGAPVVVKADGLAGGKGAVVCRTLGEADQALEACLVARAWGAAGARVVVEEFLVGEELSVFALANGTSAIWVGAARDHKAVFDDDQGPNTGGMGAFSPVPDLAAGLEKAVMDTIVLPTVEALGELGAPYRGVVFAGLMLTADGPKVLEFNCRWGDPECQALFGRGGDDVVPALLAAARGEALPVGLELGLDAAVCVTLASGGYPGPYRTGLPISGVEAAATLPGVTVLHAGTRLEGGRLVTAGGRVLSVRARAATLGDAVELAYRAVDRISFDGMHYRSDIGPRP